jgi:two-component system chemotaxis response regulator CheY
LGTILPLKNQEKQKSNGVLIVDDMRIMRLVLSSILKDAGIPILGEATNGREALEMYSSIRPAVVVLDILMPVMDGFTALEKLMAYDSEANVVICSTLQQKFHITKALKAGAKDFLIKPFRPDLVRKVVQSLLLKNTTVHQYPSYLILD